MSDKKLDIKSAQDNLLIQLNSVKKYAFTAFIVLVAGIYGFLLFRVNTLKNAEPSTSEVTSQVQAARIPHIDSNVVKQLQSLQDNSVSVQSLFNDARSNPFQ